MSRRISFNERDAAHMYEWVRMYWVGEPKGSNICALCGLLDKRLAKFIGPKVAARVRKAVRDNPGTKSNGR